MIEYNVNANISVPDITAYTYPQGPRGVGINSIKQNKNIITVIFDDEREFELSFPNWWFGTRKEYNNMSDEEKNGYYLHFIEEDS